MKRRPNCSCVVCTKEIYRRPTQIASGNVYCSLQCCGKSQRLKHKCKVCAKEYVGNKNTCSRSCANRARSGIQYTKENKFNNAYRGKILKETVAKERGGICEHCGENNYAILQIHHMKEQYRGGGDDLINLELLCPNCHASHHLGKSLYNRKKMI